MNIPTMDAPIDAPQPPQDVPEPQLKRPFVARMIRTLAVPIILAWIALVAFLNISVPQLEAVGRSQANLDAPKNSPVQDA